MPAHGPPGSFALTVGVSSLFPIRLVIPSSLCEVFGGEAASEHGHDPGQTCLALLGRHLGGCGSAQIRRKGACRNAESRPGHLRGSSLAKEKTRDQPQGANG